MNNKLILNSIRFILILLIQIILLNNIQLWGLFTPFLYILFILLLPVDLPKWGLLVLAFITGIIIDIFNNTIGVHAFALTFVTFLRPYILKIWSPYDGYDPIKELLPNEYGFGWFIKYSFLMVAIHQFVLFYMEAFSFQNFNLLLYRWAINILFTEILILITVFATEKRE